MASDIVLCLGYQQLYDLYQIKDVGQGSVTVPHFTQKVSSPMEPGHELYQTFFSVFN